MKTGSLTNKNMKMGKRAEKQYEIDIIYKILGNQKEGKCANFNLKKKKS